MTLSKSQYIRAIQCPKMLWMDIYKPEKAIENLSLQAIFERGNEVGDLARQYFGDYSLVDFDKGLDSLLDETQKYINTGATNIAEASFSYNRLFCSVDILHRNSCGWDIVEVKSSTDVSDVYISDMAFQYHVLTNAGLNITGIYNMHLNRNYVRYGELELDRLFTIEDCTEAVLSRQSQTKLNIDSIRRYMAIADDMEPKREIGPQCESPYKCAYKGYCHWHLPYPSVFNIKRLSDQRKYDLYYDNIVSYEDIILRKPRLSKNQLLQVETEYYQRPPQINKKKIRECIDEFTYPLYFLDFETYQPAIPKFDATSPYMQIPFQYSLHALQSENSELEHYEFLAKEGTDPRRELAERLCNDIPLDVCTLAFNMTFEKGVIRNLAELYPDLAEHLMNIHDNIKDLMTPFQKKYYYSAALEGSYSIKYVLPAMCPNDPELDYHSLEGIRNGGEAMTAFDGLEKRPPEEIATIRKNLLAYCRLDTLAMVKILEKLQDIC